MTVGTVVVSPPVDPTTACKRIHSTLTRLPFFRDPKEVPFEDGLYFFYEDGESTAHEEGVRIVRVGNHPHKDHRLIERLREHYSANVGAKNGSVFRRYLGGALLRRDGDPNGCLRPAPGKGHWEFADARTCPRCTDYERRVTEVLRTRFTFRCVNIPDKVQRNRLEARLIASLAACPACGPSDGWLGQFAYQPNVIVSGLWNDRHVGDEPADENDLSQLETLISATLATDVLVDLRHTLILMPCSSSKGLDHRTALPVVRFADSLGADAVSLLESCRTTAFNRPKVKIEVASEIRPAIDYYTGYPYRVPRFKMLLERYLRMGGHALIISGGYGIVHPQEPIHDYQAHIGQTAGVWKRAIPRLLREYITLHKITRTFAAFSKGYASVVPSRLSVSDWRCIPSFQRGTRPGNPQREVPKEAGEALEQLLACGLKPDERWVKAG